MKTRVALILFLFCFLLFPAMGFAKGDTTETILTLSGLKRSVESIPSSLAMNLSSEDSLEMTPGERKLVAARISAAFQARDLYGAVYKNVKENFDSKMIPDLMNLFRNPVYQKMVRFEAESDRPEMKNERKKFKEDFQSNPPDRERINLILRMMAVTNAEDTNVQFEFLVTKGILVALNATKPQEQQLTKVKFDLMMGKVREEMEKSIKSDLVLELLFTYRKATNQELSIYTSLLQSDEDRELNRLADAGLMKALEASVGKAGKSASNVSVK